MTRATNLITELEESLEKFLREEREKHGRLPSLDLLEKNWESWQQPLSQLVTDFHFILQNEPIKSLLLTQQKANEYFFSGMTTYRNQCIKLQRELEAKVTELPTTNSNAANVIPELEAVVSALAKTKNNLISLKIQHAALQKKHKKTIFYSRNVSDKRKKLLGDLRELKTDNVTKSEHEELEIRFENLCHHHAAQTQKLEKILYEKKAIEQENLTLKKENLALKEAYPLTVKTHIDPFLKLYEKSKLLEEENQLLKKAEGKLQKSNRVLTEALKEHCKKTPTPRTSQFFAKSTDVQQDFQETLSFHL